MKTISLNFAKMALYLFVGLSITLVSCSGEDGKDGINGEMGIQGEQGPQGPQGEQGEQGEQGQDGQDGNANVIVSDWMHITWDYENTDVPPTLGQMFIDQVPGISDIEAFLETGGVVLFYLKRDFGLGTATILLPYQDGSEHLYAYTSTTTHPDFLVNGFVITGESNNVTSFENNDNFLVRYVLVPTNIVATSGLANKMPESFGEAATLLGLEK